MVDLYYCFSNQIILSAIAGDPDLYVSFSEQPSLDKFDYREEAIGGDVILLCPPFRSLDVYISVFSYRTLTRYDITVLMLPAIFVPISLSRREGTSEVTVVGDGEWTTFTFEQGFDYYTRQYVMDPILNQSCFLHVESDGQSILQLVYNNVTYPATFSKPYDGRSYLDISLCDPGVNNFTNYTSISSLLSSSETVNFFFTTANASRVLPLSTLSLLDATHRLSLPSFVNILTSKLCEEIIFWSSTNPGPIAYLYTFINSSAVAFPDTRRYV